MGEERHRGFSIKWNEPPVSQVMWGLEIAAETDELHAKHLKYRDAHGPFATPVGTLENALSAARTYIDAVLAPS